MTRPAQSEAALHAAVAQFLDLALPDDAVWTHVMNEGKRGWKGQRGVKQLGVRKGWPDIQIIWDGRFHALELKSATGRVAIAQWQAVEDITKAGGFVAIPCRSLGDVERALLEWHIPLKAKAT